MATSSALRHVTLYACDQAMGLSLGLTQDVWAFAAMLQEKVIGIPMQVQLVTVDGGPISSFGGMEVKADAAIDDVEETDLVVLHAIWGDPTPILAKQQSLYPKLRKWHEQGLPILAATTGSFLLAEAGLLDGRMCTTHWHKHEELQVLYPNIQVHKERFITSSGGLYCSAGMNAGLEVMIHVLAQYSSPQVAKTVEDAFLVDFRRGYSSDSISQSINMHHQSFHQDDEILAVQQWMELHFSESLTVVQVAEKANMSLRTFKRRFKGATGVTPLHYLQQLRVQQGKDLLKHSNLSVAQIAWNVGYEDAGHFGRLFKRECGSTPAQWRKERMLRG